MGSASGIEFNGARADRVNVFQWRGMAQRTAGHRPSSLRVGVDLVRVADVAASLARFGDRYAARLFTSDERAYCREDETRAAERFAARFAAKEATLKVLRPTEYDGIDWRSIEVRRLDEGACEIVLHGEALSLAYRGGIDELSISMSHEADYATATVVARIGAAQTTQHAQRSTIVHAARQGDARHSQSSWDA